MFANVSVPACSDIIQNLLHWYMCRFEEKVLFWPWLFDLKLYFYSYVLTDNTAFFNIQYILSVFSVPLTFPCVLCKVIIILKCLLFTPLSSCFHESYHQCYVCFLQSAPPQISARGRTDDLSTILSVIDDAQKFVYISVMDYLPLSEFTEPLRWWAS